MSGAMSSDRSSRWTLHVALHPRPGEARRAGVWPVAGLASPVARWEIEPGPLPPLPTTFADASARLEGLAEIHLEPDGFFVWGAGAGRDRWQIGGNLYDSGPQLAYVDCKLEGPCPAARWLEFVAAIGGGATLMAQAMHEGVMLDVDSLAEALDAS